ncbi:PSD1 and planctomycete cytochrome C domain-containing protein [Bryobacter aggregatus]|uniref:PSD1 and planctomycete cytochrome C domain-containing protein n=1 Tax=Bryobacter aggregatus TaxID=360054 RepID=UPI0004E1D6C2|nr:PSD1 and planctomycete cytochrome C domain-containing protein [Bryobacter aggregatus]
MRWIVILTGTIVCASAQDKRELVEQFEMKVRPILAKSCYGCHTQAAMGGLRMDSREGLLQGGKSGAAVVEGKPEASLLIQAIEQTHDKLKMPPSGKLPQTEIDLIAKWVRDGAVYPERMQKAAPAGAEVELTAEQRAFWSFQPVRKVSPPAVKNEKWARTPIDRFILARLEKDGVAPSKAADRRTLLRRATFDLTGLPPTPAETKAFVDDPSPKAWEKVIDRLLASPHYGERWGRYWLDVARYADDKLNSTQDEPYPNAFRYRNWVIDAFNRDLPYNQFVKAQIAGDLMPSKDPNQFAAGTGFFALSPEMQDERVDALTRGFLGLTVACAQCHDHKFDPIPTKDFYSLQGILNSSELHETPLADAEVVKTYAAQKKDMEIVEKRVKDFYENQSRILGDVLGSQTATYLMGTQGYGDLKSLDEETLTRWKKYVESDRIYHPFLNQFRLLAKAKAPEAELRKEAEKFELTVLAVNEEKKLVDEKNKVLLGVDPTRNDLSQTQLVAMDRDKIVLWRDLFERSITDAGGGFRYNTGVMYYGKGTIERFLGGAWKAYLDDQTKLEQAKRKALPEQYAFLQTLSDKEKPADMKIYVRGDRNNQGDLAPRRFLAILSGKDRALFHQGSGRLQLAEAMVDPSNPLTPRVIVNRVWQQHFGRGIVATPSNFGQLGERPTHPELLDYLAATFVEGGWSLKKLHKAILMSTTYGLSVETVEANLNKDPDNKLFWRANRRRVDAETLRDSLLFASGELDLTPVVAAKPQKLDDDKNARRTVYGFISRRKVDGMLALFDFPNPQATSESRMSTLVPPQRLFLMNSPFVESRATALSKRLSGTEEEKVKQAYRILYCREPDATELKLGVQFLGGADWTQYARVLLGSNEFLFVN